MNCRHVFVWVGLCSLVLGTVSMGADPVERTLERAKQRRQDDIARASKVHQATIDRNTAAIRRV